MKRRDFLKTVAVGTTACLPDVAALLDAQDAAPPTTMGIVEYSFSVNPRTKSTLDFLECTHALGAGGVQTGLDKLSPDYLEQVRRRASELHMYLEVIVGLPDGGRVDDFERHVVAAKQAGAFCLRSACLSGRRYEDFSSLDEWKRFVAGAKKRIALALPIVEKHRMPLGLENHKDWTASELVSLMKAYSSEYLGVCLDTGNNLSLLDDPMDLVESLAPYAFSTHFKDMAVEEYPEGFLLAEVPLGQGFLNLRHAVDVIRKAKPRIHFSLEMITRDPLRVPCLTDKYWASFPDRGGLYLARTLRLVREHRSSKPLTKVSGLSRDSRQKLEEENVRQCLAYAGRELGLEERPAGAG
ncbi:MAG TPA: TIM barrel protein [Terriglobia bacterium]|nr:TIM barrel protein [Terriglobia bacterium]